MRAKYIDKRVYIAKVVTLKGNKIKFAILARDLGSALDVVKAHESYSYAASLSIKPQYEQYTIDLEYDEAKE